MALSSLGISSLNNLNLNPKSLSRSKVKLPSPSPVAVKLPPSPSDSGVTGPHWLLGRAAAVLVATSLCLADPALAFKKMALLIVVPVMVLFTMTALASRFILHDHQHRKMLVGSIGLVASMSMYSSPLVAMAPNFIGSPMGILQLVLYFIYRNRPKSQEPLKMDMEKNSIKLQVFQAGCLVMGHHHWL